MNNQIISALSSIDVYFLSNKYDSSLNINMKMNIHIVKINYTEIQFNQEKDEDLYALFISFIYSKNI